jgi:peptidoglycan L-alanyl-D-glutamate endopeptidase CwlK
MSLYIKDSKGKDVKKIQTRLEELKHYGGPVDGDFGLATERAVKAFQRSKGLGVDGKVGPNTWKALFEEEKTNRTFPQPTVLSASTLKQNKKRLNHVHPILSAMGQKMIDLCAQNGIAVLITQGLRTWEEQDELYAKGRTIAPIGRGHTVTNAKGGTSFHNFGLAFDIVILDELGKPDWNTSNPAWNRTGQIGKSAGLEWGGDWKTFKDLPHFQYVGRLTTADCRKLYASSGLQAVWDKLS